jgi:hypothetical protein
MATPALLEYMPERSRTPPTAEAEAADEDEHEQEQEEQEQDEQEQEAADRAETETSDIELGWYRLQKKRIVRTQAAFGSERLSSLRKGAVVEVVQACVLAEGTVRVRVADAGWLTFDAAHMAPAAPGEPLLDGPPPPSSSSSSSPPPPLLRRRASCPNAAAATLSPLQRPGTGDGGERRSSSRERSAETAAPCRSHVRYGEPIRSAEVPLSERLRKKKERRRGASAGHGLGKQTKWQARQARELQIQEAQVAMGGGGGGGGEAGGRTPSSPPAFRGMPSDGVCAVCLDQMRDPVMLSCGHRFCRECATLVRTAAAAAAAAAPSSDQARARCPVCRRPSMRRFFVAPSPAPAPAAVAAVGVAVASAV